MLRMPQWTMAPALYLVQTQPETLKRSSGRSRFRMEPTQTQTAFPTPVTTGSHTKAQCKAHNTEQRSLEAEKDRRQAAEQHWSALQVD